MNNRGSAAFLMIVIIAVMTASMVGSLQDDSLEIKLVKKTRAKDLFQEMIRSIESSLMSNCKAVLENQNIDGTIPAPGLNFIYTINAGGIDNPTTLSIGQTLKGFTITDLSLESNAARPAQGPLNMKGAFFHVEAEFHEGLKLGSPELSETIYLMTLTDQEVAPMIITDCMIAGDFNENCWMVGLPYGCTREQWLAMTYSRACYAVFSDTTVDAATCTDGSNRTACCDPEDPNANLMIQDLWQLGFGPPSP